MMAVTLSAAASSQLEHQPDGWHYAPQPSLTLRVVPETPSPYNPLDRVELGKSVERALLAQPLVPLPPRRFAGAGLYAIYYLGNFPAYALITPPQRNAGEVPIYVGRARPEGARQGIIATTPNPVLFLRLREHANSIKQVQAHAATTHGQNLQLEDFKCRYLVADDIWVPLGEALLIGRYRPVWNVVVDGFGNHAPGSGRAAQARSPWDELHPGRPWAARLPRPRLSTEMITEEVRAHLAHLVVPDLDATPVLDVDTEVALQREAAVRLATATMTRRHSRPPDPTPCRPAAIASRRGTLHRDPPTDCQDPP